jgi:hypothetical protein
MYLCRKAGIKDLKETFWLLLRLWAKVTRSAERNKGRGYKAFEWELYAFPRRSMGTRPQNPTLTLPLKKWEGTERYERGTSLVRPPPS